MIANGGSYRCVLWWADHLQSKDNDRATIVKSHGLRSESIHDMLSEMEAQAQGTRCQNFFYQMNLNPVPGERLSEAQWDRVREIAEKHHGFEGQAYFVVEHVKHGRAHQHIVWSRIDIENVRAISDSNDARKNHAIAREIEQEFGLQQVKGPYDREPGEPRPKRAPEPWEMYRGMKTGLDPRDVAAEVTELFHQSDSGKAFQAALEEHGYMLVRGDRRGFVILDGAGKEHSLARRIEGMNTKELNAFMRDVDRDKLPTVEQGRALYQQRKIAGLEADRATVEKEIAWEDALAKAAIEKEKLEKRFVEPERRTLAGDRKKENQAPPETAYTPMDRFKEAGLEMAGTTARPVQGVEKQLWNVCRSGPEAGEFAQALDRRGIAFACVNLDEAYKSYREAEFAKAVGRVAPVYEAGEIVVVRAPGPEYLRQGEWIAAPRVQKLDQAHAEKYLDILSLDKSKLKGIEATKAVLETSALDRAAYWQDIRLERATNINTLAPVRSARNTTATLEKAGGRAVGAAFDVAEKLLEGLFSLIDPPTTPLQREEAAERARYDREAQTERVIDFSRYTSERAEQQRIQDNQREAIRQQQRDRDRDR